MFFLIFSISTLILLLILIFIGSIDQFSIQIVTKKKIEFVVVLLPAMLSLISLTALTAITSYILKLFNIKTIYTLVSIFLKWDFDIMKLTYLAIAYTISTLIFLILQAYCIKLINIDYKKIWDRIRKVFKVKENCGVAILNGNTLTTPPSEVSINLVHYSKYEKISFVNSLLASLFSFSLIFFLFILFLVVGAYIGGRII